MVCWWRVAGDLSCDGISSTFSMWASCPNSHRYPFKHRLRVWGISICLYSLHAQKMWSFLIVKTIWNARFFSHYWLFVEDGVTPLCIKDRYWLNQMQIVDIFQKVLKEAKSRLGEILSAFEFVDRPALKKVWPCVCAYVTCITITDHEIRFP